MKNIRSLSFAALSVMLLLSQTTHAFNFALNTGKLFQYLPSKKTALRVAAVVAPVAIAAIAYKTGLLGKATGAVKAIDYTSAAEAVKTAANATAGSVTGFAKEYKTELIVASATAAGIYGAKKLNQRMHARKVNALKAEVAKTKQSLPALETVKKATTPTKVAVALKPTKVAKK